MPNMQWEGKLFGENDKVVHDDILYLDRGTYFNGAVRWVSDTRFASLWDTGSTWIGEFKEDALYSSLELFDIHGATDDQILEAECENSEPYWQNEDEGVPIEWFSISAEGDGLLVACALAAARDRTDILKEMIPVMTVACVSQVLMMLVLISNKVFKLADDSEETFLVTAICITLFVSSVLQAMVTEYSLFFSIREKLSSGWWDWKWKVATGIMFAVNLMVTVGVFAGGTICILSGESNIEVLLNTLATNFVMDIDNLLLAGFMVGYPRNIFSVDIVDFDPVAKIPRICRSLVFKLPVIPAVVGFAAAYLAGNQELWSWSGTG